MCHEEGDYARRCKAVHNAKTACKADKRARKARRAAAQVNSNREVCVEIFSHVVASKVLWAEAKLVKRIEEQLVCV